MADELKKPDDQETDSLSVNLPMGGSLNVSGPNASKLWGKIGWSIIIGTCSLAIAHLMRTLAEIMK